MIKGVNKVIDPFGRSPFRSAMTTPEGGQPAWVHEARVVDVNLTNWTVDCITQFDGKKFADIQVASPYQHPNRGEGLYVMPEIGSKCLVCLPSDGPPPYVLGFIMPAEAVADATSDDADGGTQGPQTVVTGNTFAGGRTKAKPGDIVLKGRDGSFVMLHRGGVLQFGSTELAQRICIPLGNLVTDISQNYKHHNSGGSINWGIRPGTEDGTPETEYRQTFRVFADDEYADVRIAVGNVHQPVPEKPGAGSSAADLAELNIGRTTTVYEMVIAPGGFETDAGAPTVSARDLVKVRMFFDRDGNGMLRAEGSVSVRVKKRLRLRVDQEMSVYGAKNLTAVFDETVRIQGNKGVDIATNRGVVRLNGGTKPVAHVGSQIYITILAPVPIVTDAGKGVIVSGATFSGVVSTGNPTVLV